MKEEIKNKKTTRQNKKKDLEIKTIDESEKKLVTIKYIAGFTNEYSLDYGNTWIPYINPITIEEM